MIKVAALTGGRYSPSARFRFRQHYELLLEEKIYVKEYCPSIEKNTSINKLTNGRRLREIPHILPLFLMFEIGKFISLVPGVLRSRSHDVIWLERGLYSGFPTIEWGLKKPLVLDIDDAVWHSPPFGESQIKKTAMRADKIIAGNNYLANWLNRFSKNISIVPTSIDTNRFTPEINRTERPFTIGWTGTSGNFKYLKSISHALNKFFEYSKKSRILIVADKFPDNINLPHDRIHFVKWSEDNEAVMVQKMDVGLMPLADDDWCRGKCSFKMLQYMATGIPVIVSPVGMNAEVLDKGNIGIGATRNDQWLDALISIHDDENQRLLMGKNGRLIVEHNYSQRVIGKLIAENLMSVAL